MALNPSKRILYGVTKSNFGGAQRHVYDLALAAKEAGSEVAVLCGGDGLLVQKLQKENIRVITIPSLGKEVSPYNDIQSGFQIMDALREFKPDVFHIHSSKMGGIGGVAGRMVGIKNIILTAHGFAFNESRPLIQKIGIRFFAWLTILLSHKTICVSAKLKSQVKNWPFVGNKLYIVRNGIEKYPILTQGEAREILASDLRGVPLLIGTLSELHYTKGLDLLIKSFAEVFKNKSAGLLIMGNGSEKENLLELSRRLGVESQVHFKDFIPEARQYLRALDIFTLTSRTEGLPYALLEAGLAGLPVVASAVGGIPEIIENRVSGILVNKEDTSAIAGALDLLSKDPGLRHRLGEALKRTVESKFSKKEMLEAIFALY